MLKKNKTVDTPSKAGFGIALNCNPERRKIMFWHASDRLKSEKRELN